MKVEKNQDMSIFRIEGDIREEESELQKQLDELIAVGRSKIILDIREAELDMNYRNRLKEILSSANSRANKLDGELVLLTVPGRRINLRIPDGLDLEKFYIEGQALEFMQKLNS